MAGSVFTGSALTKKYNDTRVDWQKRDRGTASQVMTVILNELSGNTKPRRLTISSIGKQIQQLSLLQQHLNKLPETAEVIHKHSETIDDFQVRRVMYVVKMLHEQGEVILEWKIIRAAGLKPGYSEIVSKAIETCLKDSISL